MPRFALYPTIGLIAALLMGCGERMKESNGPVVLDTHKSTDTKPANTKPADTKASTKTDTKTTTKTDTKIDTKTDTKGGRDWEPREAPRKALMDEARAGTDKPLRNRSEMQVPAGVLTAGSFDDNLYPHYFRSFAGKVGQNHYLGKLAGRMLGQRLEICVRNGRGAPVGNARVRVGGVAGGRSVELTTRSDGRAIFLSSWDEVHAESELEVAAALRGNEEWVKRRVPKEAIDCTVLLPTAAAPLPRNLDLAIVLDTTSSMGDEIQYLKAEIRSIAAAVRDQFPQVNQRYSLVLYRDEGMGDEYVTRVFDFTSNIDQFQKTLAAQNAGGGGDTPEAMHKGLEEATRLSWRDGDTARVLFLIADAPPHAQDGPRTMECVDILRRKGVAIYPVAASCNDPTAGEATEFFMRSAALLTGAQYLFLTDDSGVGEAHGEPRIPFYRVEKLNRALIRMISGELAGRRADPDPRDVLRTVGSPPRSGRQD